MKLAAAVGVVAWIRVWLDLELEHFQQKTKRGSEESDYDLLTFLQLYFRIGVLLVSCHFVAEVNGSIFGRTVLMPLVLMGLLLSQVVCC